MPDLHQTRRWFAGVDADTTVLDLSGTTIGAELGPRVMRTSNLHIAFPALAGPFHLHFRCPLCSNFSSSPPVPWIVCRLLGSALIGPTA